MNPDIRNAYDLPVMDRVARAKQYASEAKERNKPACECEACRLKELEPGVIQLVERWQL